MANRHRITMLQAIHACSPQAYGVPVRDHIRTHRGEDWSYGAIYMLFERLERDGLIRGEWGEATAERGWRRKRCYFLTEDGLRALADEGTPESTRRNRALAAGRAFAGRFRRALGKLA